jgi:hypothetical protein
MTYAKWEKSGKDTTEISDTWMFWVRWYERACKKLFGKTITFILRDFYHARPICYHFVLFAVLAVLKLYGWETMMWLGALLGHLFW